MAQVKYNVVARVGEYEKDGETKARWQNVGVVLQTDKGHILLLEPWFNPAGVPRDGDKALLSLFPPQQGDGRGQENARQTASQGPQRGPVFSSDGDDPAANDADFDDPIPF